jgi:glycosyltransferase involved in cell wall biosynthesis
MQQGTPVITSKITSMPEVAGEAGLLVDPFKVEDIAKSIKKVLSDKALHEKLVKDGYLQAKKFSWKKCAQQTLRLYQEVFK